MVRQARRSQNTASGTIDGNIVCVFVENALVFVVPKKWEGPGPPLRPNPTDNSSKIEVVARPVLQTLQ